MKGPPNVVVVGLGVVEEGRPVGSPPTGFRTEPERLRRMDRFGRCGFLAGSLALAELLGAPPEPGKPSDPRRGVVFGTAYGCRDSIVDHARLLARAATVDDLSPGVFAETVHNTANGELAIEWRLGGLSEVLVSGRAAGLEALLLAAGAVEDGAADLVVAGGAEGIHDAMRAAFDAERRLAGDASDVNLLEAGAALVLASDTAAEANGWPVLATFAGGTTFFEPDEAAARARLRAWRGEARTFDEEATGARRTERLAADGPFRAARLVREIAAGRVLSALVAARDPAGPTAAVAFEAPTPALSPPGRSGG